MSDLENPPRCKAPCPGPDAHITHRGTRSCNGHVRQEGREGTPCLMPPTPGGYVCHRHGGRTPAVKAAAQTRVAEARAAAEVALLGARRDIHPAEALLELVHWTAGEVDYWRARVELLALEDEDALTWGMSKSKTGGDDRGDTYEAAPNVAYRMLTDASNRLAQYATAALKAGVDERRVQLAERQGALVADVIRGILADLKLTPEQQQLVAVVVPTRLRELTGGPA